MKLTRRLVLHARMQGGAILRHDVCLDEKVVGTMTTTINKKTRRWTESVTYEIGGQTFRSLAEFIAEIDKRRTNDA